jgi:nucleoside-diphosphate-sugar epimerase
MKRILIIGGGGMVGQKLARHLAAEGLDGSRDIEVSLFDMVFPEEGAPADHRITGQLGNPEDVTALVEAKYDVIFHLAAIVSGESETDFQKGWDINGASILHFIRKMEEVHTASGGAYVPRVVFTSSIAVFGPPFPDYIPDDQPRTPQTSYGAQKACAELMMNDIGRRGIAETIAIRLPTIVVRPGKANLAASSFFSGIIREPLNGQEARLPVDEDVRHWHASPRAAVGFLVHAATMDLARLGDWRVLSMPGVSCTVGEQLQALERAAGPEALKLVRREPDPQVRKIVSGWARGFDPQRALELGFRAEKDFDEIVRVYIEDELGGAVKKGA